jgi:hypothetical protein
MHAPASAEKPPSSWKEHTRRNQMGSIVGRLGTCGGS